MFNLKKASQMAGCSAGSCLKCWDAFLKRHYLMNRMQPNSALFREPSPCLGGGKNAARMT